LVDSWIFNQFAVPGVAFGEFLLKVILFDIVKTKVNLGEYGGMERRFYEMIMLGLIKGAFYMKGKNVPICRIGSRLEVSRHAPRKL
jgi:hypothetical protein